MTAGPVPSVDHHHVGVGMLDECVDETHPERARADDEVVGLEPDAVAGAGDDHGLSRIPLDAWCETYS